MIADEETVALLASERMAMVRLDISMFDRNDPYLSATNIFIRRMQLSL